VFSNREGPKRLTREAGLRLVRAVASVAMVLVPSYTVERITEYYFLAGSPVFGDWSGPRIWLFIALILTGSIATGALLRSFVPAAICSVLGVTGLLFLFYVFCIPKVCYSTGADGLEPLRMGLDLSSIGMVGASIGATARSKRPPLGLLFAAVSFATFVAVAYYPVIFTFAGTRLLGAFHPWGVVTLLFIVSFSTAAATSARTRALTGFIVTLVAGAVTFLVALGIARAYLSLIVGDILLMVSALVVGASVGALVMGRHGNSRLSRFASSSKPLTAAVILVLLMTVVFYPDAAVGVVPRIGASGAASVFGMGVPVYAGGYMDSALDRVEAVSLNVSFAGTNASSIQADNYLAAGIGVHSPGCCVDGIDYGYRFDDYLFRNGNEILVASAWEVCDYVSACGGHSWKVLMFLNYSDIGSPSLSSVVHLAIEWRMHAVYWIYEVGAGPSKNLTGFEAPTQENPYFDIGFVAGSGSESGYYFFQFGITSRFPIGRGGWSVAFECPAYLAQSRWQCVSHARTLQGSQSFWKVLWRWGEDYPNVKVVQDDDHGVVFSYSLSTTMADFQSLW